MTLVKSDHVNIGADEIHNRISRITKTLNLIAEQVDNMPDFEEISSDLHYVIFQVSELKKAVKESS